MKRPNSVGYFSSYDRGLECLLALWPHIRAEVPTATLDVAYGWEAYVGIRGEDAFYERMNAQFIELSGHGVTEHGRLSHTKLHELMKTTQVWAYPTEFTEIHCITALKAQAAGMYPVVTPIGALDETVQSGVRIYSGPIYTDHTGQKEFVAAVITALRENRTGTAPAGCDWADVARVWQEVIRGA